MWLKNIKQSLLLFFTISLNSITFHFPLICTSLKCLLLPIQHTKHDTIPAALTALPSKLLS